MIVSNNLRAALRRDGYAKLAAEVMRDQHEYVTTIDDLAGAAKSLAVKIAANRANQKVIRDGLTSLRRTQER